MGRFLFQLRGAQAQDTTTALGKGTDPSPVTLRLMKAPERDTLSPRERAVYSVLLKCRNSRVPRLRDYSRGRPSRG
jgi:hypothetical protein